MKYTVTIRTLDDQEFQYELESNSRSEDICTQLFNQTPNVRGVEVFPVVQ